MKIISLNTWGGRAGKDGILKFFKKHKGDIDIFCLQEIWAAPYEHLKEEAMGGVKANHDEIMIYGKQEISEIMHEYDVYFRPHHLENYGLMMLVRKDLYVIEEGEIFVHKFKGYLPEGDVGHHARNIQYVTIEKENGERVSVLNFHGLWNGKGKTDSEDRLLQSQNILTFTSSLSNPFTLLGDFNLEPTTQSIAMLEQAGLENLIKKYGITSTRTSHYKKEGKYADYAFVSKGVEVKNFQVLSDEVSDHSPLYLEIT